MLSEASNLPGCVHRAEHPIIRDILGMFWPCTFPALLEFKRSLRQNKNGTDCKYRVISLLGNSAQLGLSVCKDPVLFSFGLQVSHFSVLYTRGCQRELQRFLHPAPHPAPLLHFFPSQVPPVQTVPFFLPHRRWWRGKGYRNAQCSPRDSGPAVNQPIYLVDPLRVTFKLSISRAVVSEPK